MPQLFISDVTVSEFKATGWSEEDMVAITRTQFAGAMSRWLARRLQRPQQANLDINMIDKCLLTSLRVPLL